MSAKKSWDIAPRAKPAAARPAARSMRDIQSKPKPATAVPASTRNVTIARGAQAKKEKRTPLKKQRSKKRKFFIIALSVLLAVAIAGIFYVLWLPVFRMHEVHVTGAHAEEVKVITQRQLEGSHLFIVPRNSLFFIPEDDIRSAVLDAHPDIEALSISADGLTTLTLAVAGRAEAFLWCGESLELPSPFCYETNAEGLIFAVSEAQASTTPALKVYAPVEGVEGDTPLRSHVVYASRIPDALKFVKAMQQLKASVVSVVIRGDEADLYTTANTRITYVLGQEQEAAITAASIFPQLNLNNGSIEYVDLRFSGKGYFKRRESI
ncbi:hypothetical protein KKD81_03155 [Patescibacteria group bacterium]|nr:hypothetical protein [Patescibacteria group bacterium]MBU2159119.1 hypothetical protein [Patescibacteria group bacterium]MBU2220908.1 hypothetical protein [Patescibacteria group bacterium]